MTNDKTCGTCRHWQRTQNSYGRCAESTSSLLFAGGPKGITTAEDFGCNQYEPAAMKRRELIDTLMENGNDNAPLWLFVRHDDGGCITVPLKQAMYDLSLQRWILADGDPPGRFVVERDDLASEEREE